MKVIENIGYNRYLDYLNVSRHFILTVKKKMISTFFIKTIDWE